MEIYSVFFIENGRFSYFKKKMPIKSYVIILGTSYGAQLKEEIKSFKMSYI